jgi:VCBS repeat-containing protein
MQMAADEVLFRLALQARASVEDFYDIDENGQPMLNLKKARDFGLLPLVKKLKLDARGNWEVELHDSQQALVQLGKFHSLWTDKITVEDDDVNKSVPELEQRVDRITLLLNAARDRRDRQSDSGK